MIGRTSLPALSAAALAGCAGIQFSSADNGKSHPYRVATPALKVVTAQNCEMTAEMISIPGRLNYLSFKTGLGSINDTVEFEPGGTIKRITADQKGVAQDLSTLIGAAGKLGGPFNIASQPPELSAVGEQGCVPSVEIYPLDFDPRPGSEAVAVRAPLLRIEARRATDKP